MFSLSEGLARGIQDNYQIINQQSPVTKGRRQHIKNKHKLRMSGLRRDLHLAFLIARKCVIYFPQHWMDDFEGSKDFNKPLWNKSNSCVSMPP